MEDYGNNSHRAKQEKKDVEKETHKRPQKVVEVKVKKKGKLQKIAGIFFSDDARNIKDYVIFDLIIPWVKDMFVDTIVRTANRAVYGDGGRRRKRYDTDRSDYGNMYRYKGGDRDRDRDRESRRVRPQDYENDEDLIFESQGDAEYVLDCLYDYLSEYKLVRVSDLYDLVGKPCPYTLERYGWADLRGARVVRLRRDEFRIDLPRAMVID